MQKIDKAYVESIFSYLAKKGEYEKFFNYVDNNVHWTVKGTHPIAGVYNNKDTFINSTFRRLNRLLKEGVLIKVANIFVEDATAIVEMQALSTQKNNKPFNNEYCWIVKFNETGIITNVRAYLDSTLVKELIENNE